MRPALVLRPGRQILRQLFPCAGVLGAARDGRDDPVAPEGVFGVVGGGRVRVQEEEGEARGGSGCGGGGERGEGDGGFFGDVADADERAVGGGFGGEGDREVVGWGEGGGDERGGEEGGGFEAGEEGLGCHFGWFDCF